MFSEHLSAAFIKVFGDRFCFGDVNNTLQAFLLLSSQSLSHLSQFYILYKANPFTVV